MISRVNITFLRELARGRLRYRDAGILESRKAKRAKTESYDETYGSLESTASASSAGESASAAGAASSAGAGAAASAKLKVKKEDDEIDLNDVKEVEVIDLTTEEIDLTQDLD
jgi:hypothetical protein